MKKLSLYVLDMFIILISTFLGFILRENFETDTQRLLEVIPYFLATFVAAAIIIPIFGINRLIWRFSAMPDYLRLTFMMATVTIGSVAIAFAIHRLDGVPRSLPFLQFNLALTFLIGLRVFYRLHHSRRRSLKAKMSPLKVVEPEASETVLVVGLSRLTEIYLKSVTELGRDRIKIAGILGNHGHHVGRLVATNKVLGTPEDLQQVVFDLKISGVELDKNIITAPVSHITSEGHRAISEMQNTGAVEIIYLSERLGFERIGEKAAHKRSVAASSLHKAAAFEIRSHELETMHRRSYWSFKRAFDFVA
jgi:FlaA1/EpsC-like NDP-sugar epimerase